MQKNRTQLYKKNFRIKSFQICIVLFFQSATDHCGIGPDFMIGKLANIATILRSTHKY